MRFLPLIYSSESQIKPQQFPVKIERLDIYGFIRSVSTFE
jgi:hypothetical protein